MAKYLLSYDEQDVKNGKLDVSPDGVLKSAGKGGSDDPVLPQKVLFSDYKDYEGHSQTLRRPQPPAEVLLKSRILVPTSLIRMNVFR